MKQACTQVSSISYKMIIFPVSSELAYVVSTNSHIMLALTNVYPEFNDFIQAASFCISIYCTSVQLLDSYI